MRQTNQSSYNRYSLKNSSDIDVGANEIGINSNHSYFNARNIIELPTG